MISVQSSEIIRSKAIHLKVTAKEKETRVKRKDIQTKIKVIVTNLSILLHHFQVKELNKTAEIIELNDLSR